MPPPNLCFFLKSTMTKEMTTAKGVDPTAQCFFLQTEQGHNGEVED